ncbi:MAG: formate/nitrite transporter family protein, partial [Paracoccaceae bacterium]
EAEEQSVEEASKLSSRLIYEVIRREGEEELSRPLMSLLWSGVAAGLLISTSVLGEAILRGYLPDTGWRFLIENFGYSLGFLLVIVGRMQLFTENTITTVLPLVARPTWANFWCVARLWMVVLGANVVGAFAAAGFIVFSGAFDGPVGAAIMDLSRHATGFGVVEGFMKAVPAGVIVAAIVWMLPSAENNEFAIIVVFTWLIAAGDFAHVVAGSVEMGIMLMTGGLSELHGLLRFFLPVLAGNIVGGTIVFTLMAWGQVKEEVEE